MLVSVLWLSAIAASIGAGSVPAYPAPGYSETDTNGGGFALSYNSRTGNDTRSELGTRFDRVLALYTNAVLSLRARLPWAHDWVSDPTLPAVFQTLPGASFIVNGATPARNSALASAGTELRIANGVTLLGKLPDWLKMKNAACARCEARGGGGLVQAIPTSPFLWQNNSRLPA